MAKKVIKKKLKKISNNKNEKDLAPIEILKKNLLEKSDKTNKKQKDKKVETIKKKKKEKEKEKKILQKKNLSQIIKQIKNEEKENKKEENNNNIQLNEIIPENGGILSLKKENSKNKSFLDNKKQEKNQTIYDIINNTQNLEEVKLVSGMSSTNVKSKNNQRKKNIIKKEALENKISTKNQKDEKDKNEYIKMVKSKIVMVNGKMTIEKPDVGLITKKYNEETNKYLSPKETIFVSKDEEVVNSLSFIKMEHTKKRSTRK